MAESVEDLNYQFNYNLFMVKSMINNLRSQQDKQRVLRWLKKLSAGNRTMREMKVRNEFVYHLVLNVQAGELQNPFKDPPPSGPLPAFAQLLPGGNEGIYTGQIDPNSGGWSGEVDRASPQRPILYRNSPDGGAFLAAQPIPKCGAFCYMAVISKPRNDR